MMTNNVDNIESLAVRGTLLEVFRSKGIGAPVADELDCTKGLIKYMDMTKNSFVFGIYSLASQPIADAMKNMHSRGVAMRGISDNSQWGGKFSLAQSLKDAGIDIIRAVHQHSCMHIKVGVSDNNICMLGSFNWTNNAEQHNDECLLVFQSAEAASVLTTQIDQARTLNNA